MNKLIDKFQLFSLLFIFTVTVVFFAYPPTITYDSSHYVQYLEVITGYSSWSNWDAVRGPVFPYLIFILVKTLGFSVFSINVFLYIFYILFTVGVFILLDLSKAYKKEKKYFDKFLKTILFLFIILNPIIFGYFHTFLTEAIAISIVPWIVILYSRKKLNSMLLVLIGILLWFTKQPYVFLIFFAEIGLIVYNLKTKNFSKLYLQFLRAFVLIFLIFILNIMWSNFLSSKNSTTLSERGSANIVNNTANNFFSKNIFTLTENTTRSYLGLVNMTTVMWTPAPVSTYDFSNFAPNENGSIGYKFLDSCNIIGSSSSVINPSFISQVETCRRFDFYLNHLFKSLIPLTNVLFTLSNVAILMAIFPIIFIKRVSKSLTIIGLMSILYQLFFAVVGAPIDRYVVPLFSICLVFWIKIKELFSK